MFLCIVESGLHRSDTCLATGPFGFLDPDLQYNGTRFTTGTFGFRRVCRRWNEVAVGSPQLWVRWTSGAVKAWPLFKARSKGAPIFLKWRTHHLPASGLGVLADPAIPGRIHQLDFIGTSKQLEQLLDTFNSSPPSNASSIRLQSTFCERTGDDTEEHLARFLPFSFPKLSRLVIEGFHPDTSSSLLVTSNLTSLKLTFPYGIRPRDTLAQFSRILQKHPNLQELYLKNGAMPRVESAENPVPFALPRLTDLKLCGSAECILGLVNLIGTSFPPNNVVFEFRYPRDQDVPALVDTVKKILAAYYEREALDHPRRAHHLSVESRPGGDHDPITFVARPPAGPVHTPQPVLKLQFWKMDELMHILPLFPLNDVQQFTIDGLFLSSKDHHRLLQKMKDISHLELAAMDIGPVLEALDSRNRGVSKQPLRHRVEPLTCTQITRLNGLSPNSQH